ncbi:MAG: TRAM domain-containing protein, partial [Firmicutes bacterium]|nr:TRAM domain-containing protein [Bacillota bacterium]
ASNQDKVGQILEVLVEDIDEDGAYIGRTEYDAPEIDNSVIFTSERQLTPGEFVRVQINDAFDYDLVGVEV